MRIQVLVSEEERARLAVEAARAGESLSGFVRRAALERLAAREVEAPRSEAALLALFAACDAREAGREPDWEQHLEVIAASRGTGGRVP